MTKHRIAGLGALLLLTLGMTPANAASILQSKGNKVMIQLDGLSVSTGSEVYALTPDKKRKAVIRVTAIKGDRAVGTILKGAAQNGMEIALKSEGGGSQSAPKTYSSEPTSSSGINTLRKSPKRGGGVLIGMAMNSAALSAKTRVNGTSFEDSLTLKGNSYNLKGFYDYHMSPSFTIRGAIGLETLSTTGSTAVTQVCSGSTTCNLSLNYLAFEGDAQFNFVNSPSIRLWAGAGYSFLMAMSKDNNITNLEATSTNQVLLLGAGADIGVGKSGFVPVVVEYGLFPFAGISLSSIYIRSGYGWTF